MSSRDAVKNHLKQIADSNLRLGFNFGSRIVGSLVLSIVLTKAIIAWSNDVSALEAAS